jgi:DNA-binding winged helix-turn-helix (wHTH) protein
MAMRLSPEQGVCCVSPMIEKARVYSFSGFRIEVAERRLWHADEPVLLTPKQFDLLTYFVENAGQVAKKSELLEAVWADTYVEEATLARNVSWLRSKLEEHTGGKPLIETVPKLGYRFTAEVTHVADDNKATIRLEQMGLEQTRLDLYAGETIELTDSVSEETEPVEQGKKNEQPGKRSRITQKVPLRRYALSIFIALCFIVIVLVTLAASSGIASRNAPKTVTSAPKTDTSLAPKTDAQTFAVRVNATITIKNIAVDATEQAIDAGIRVLPGDTLLVGAEGLYQTGTGRTWTCQGDKTAKVSGNHVFQQADPWSLVGWIGTTEADQTNYFQAGEATPITSNKSGSLYFAVNDWQQGYANNRGGLLVTVTLTRTFDIYAEDDDVTAAWGTGLVELHKEDTLAILAAGTVSYWPGGELYDANGSHHKTDGLLAPTINTRSLIGKIGSRNPFKIGMSYPQQRVTANGWLFISINDQITRKPGAFKNNSGNISVGIEVVRAPEAFKNPI